MNGVLGMTRLLGDTQLSDEQRSYVEAIADSAEILLTVVNDLLDLAKVQAGRLDLLDTVFDPRLLVERAVKPLALKARAKCIAFNLEFALDLPARLHGDPGRLRQILVNLIGNSVKFTSAGEVRVRLSSRQGNHASLIVIDIVDTGPGFEAVEVNKLLQAFRQGQATSARMFGGTGLGLMLSNRLIQAMNGKLFINATPGTGAHFRIELPARPDTGMAGSLVPMPVSLAGLHILVVDPWPAMRDRLCNCALAWGMNVRGAAGLQDARRELQEAKTRGVRFDLLVVSADMSDGEIGHLLSIKQGDPEFEPQIISVAGSGLRGDAARALGMGFDAYLAAPFDNDDLMQLLIQLAQPSVAKTFLTRHAIADHPPRSLRVLVADDNPVNLRFASIVLDKAGHQVGAVADGAAALKDVEEGSFDLVLMDIQMPVMDGLTATRNIRLLPDPAKRNIPIVALTAEAMANVEEAVRAAGMNDFLVKPIDRPKLLSTVRFWGERSTAA